MKVGAFTAKEGFLILAAFSSPVAKKVSELGSGCDGCAL
jgi:hypothetical protein